MSVESALRRFRARQAEQFTTSATVYRPIGEAVWDAVAETMTQPVSLVYSGPCKIRAAAIRGRDETEAGETLIGTPDSDAKFPVDTDIQRGDIVTCTGSAYDPELVGRSYTVGRATPDEWQIARVVVLEEVLPPMLNEVS